MLSQRDTSDITDCYLIAIITVILEKLIQNIDISEQIETTLGHILSSDDGPREIIGKFRQKNDLKRDVRLESEVELMMSVGFSALF
jgi:hypothetical protein